MTGYDFYVTMACGKNLMLMFFSCRENLSTWFGDELAEIPSLFVCLINIFYYCRGSRVHGLCIPFGVYFYISVVSNEISDKRTLKSSG